MLTDADVRHIWKHAKLTIGQRADLCYHVLEIQLGKKEMTVVDAAGRHGLGLAHWVAAKATVRNHLTLDVEFVEIFHTTGDSDRRHRYPLLPLWHPL